MNRRRGSYKKGSSKDLGRNLMGQKERKHQNRRVDVENQEKGTWKYWDSFRL